MTPAELIEELENGYDPSMPMRELERMSELCEKAAALLKECFKEKDNGND